MIDRRSVLIGSLAALTGGVAATGAATAQEAPVPTETPTPTESPPDETTIQLDAATTVAGYRYVDGEMRIDIRSEALRRVTVTDVGAMVKSLREGSGARAVEIPSRTLSLSPNDESRLTIAATEVDGAAMVTLATAETLVLLRTDALDDDRGPVEWGTAQALAAGSAVGSAGLVYRRLKNRDEEPEEVERIA